MAVFRSPSPQKSSFVERAAVDSRCEKNSHLVKAQRVTPMELLSPKWDSTAIFYLLSCKAQGPLWKRGRKTVRGRVEEDHRETGLWTWQDFLSWTQQLWRHRDSGKGSEAVVLAEGFWRRESWSSLRIRLLPGKPRSDGPIPGICGRHQLDPGLFFKEGHKIWGLVWDLGRNGDKIIKITLYTSIKCSKNKNILKHMKCLIYLAGFSKVLHGDSSIDYSCIFFHL